LLKKLGITAELQFTEGDGNHDNHAHSE
jgi:hypothetical protein